MSFAIPQCGQWLLLRLIVSAIWKPVVYVSLTVLMVPSFLVVLACLICQFLILRFFLWKAFSPLYCTRFSIGGIMMITSFTSSRRRKALRVCRLGSVSNAWYKVYGCCHWGVSVAGKRCAVISVLMASGVPGLIEARGYTVSWIPEDQFAVTCHYPAFCKKRHSCSFLFAPHLWANIKNACHSSNTIGEIERLCTH